LTKKEWIEHLKKKSVCKPGLAWFMRRPWVDRLEVIDSLLKEKYYTWTMWTIQNTLLTENEKLFTQFFYNHIRMSGLEGLYDEWSDMGDQNNAISMGDTIPEYIDALMPVIDYGRELVRIEERK